MKTMTAAIPRGGTESRIDGEGGAAGQAGIIRGDRGSLGVEDTKEVRRGARRPGLRLPGEV